MSPICHGVLFKLISLFGNKSAPDDIFISWAFLGNLSVDVKNAEEIYEADDLRVLRFAKCFKEYFD